MNELILSKEDFSHMVDIKKSTEALLETEYRYYSEVLIWRHDPEDYEIVIHDARVKGFKEDLAAIQTAIDFTKDNITKQQLAEYRAYHYERKGKKLYSGPKRNFNK